MEFICIKKITDIINSCETEEQLNSCNNVINNYVRLMYNRGIDNPDKLYERLREEYKQKEFQIKMLEMFVDIEYRPYQKKIYKKVEKSLIKIF